MLEPIENMYTVDQYLYSPGNPVCGPSPGPYSPGQTECSSTINSEDMYDLAHALLETNAMGNRSAVVKEEIRHLIKKKRRISGYQEERGTNLQHLSLTR